MNQHPFLGGVGVGMMAGLLLGMSAASNRKALKRKAKRAARDLGELANDLTDSMGF